MRFSNYILTSLAGGAVASAQGLEQHPLLSPQSTITQPLIGFGTWNLNLSPENTTKAVSFAIQKGYRQIDCAAIYRNEKAVGEGIADGLKKANITRQEIWVTSKLWNDQYAFPSLFLV